MTSISSITLADFKKFTHFTVACRHSNILVGPNNAGKSSILDALRLLADLGRYSRRESPRLMDQQGIGVCSTYVLPTSAVSIPLGSIVRNYGDDFAKLEFKLANGRAIHMRLHPINGIFAYLVSDADPPRTSHGFRSSSGLDLVVVPTLSALEEDENYVQDATVRRNETTRLASRNFRNIVLRLSDEEFAQFEELCRRGWPDVEIHRPQGRPGQPPQVTMMFAEARIEREVHWSGFGFQVWMQIMLQIMRAKEGSVLVLDEPDIYLHPDLQRRLMRVAQDNFSQIFVATHSTELINDADPGDVLMVDASGRSARRITTDEGYRRVYAYLGSSENAEFARIAKAKRIIFFEGKERNLIRKLARKSGRGALLDDPYTIYLQAGGYSQWRRIKEVDWALHEIFGVNAKLGALFDRDYRCDEAVAEFEDELRGDDLWVGVLKRKEIENYALNEDALSRAIVERVASRDKSISARGVADLLNECADTFREDCRAQLSSMYLIHHRQRRKDMDESEHLREGMRRFDDGWASMETRLSIIPGKEFLSTLSATLQKRFGVALTIHQVVDGMNADEIDPELIEKFESLSAFFSN